MHNALGSSRSKSPAKKQAPGKNRLKGAPKSKRPPEKLIRIALLSLIIFASFIAADTTQDVWVATPCWECRNGGWGGVHDVNIGFSVPVNTKAAYVVYWQNDDKSIIKSGGTQITNTMGRPNGPNTDSYARGNTNIQIAVTPGTTNYINFHVEDLFGGGANAAVTVRLYLAECGNTDTSCGAAYPACDNCASKGAKCVNNACTCRGTDTHCGKYPACGTCTAATQSCINNACTPLAGVYITPSSFTGTSGPFTAMCNFGGTNKQCDATWSTTLGTIRQNGLPPYSLWDALNAKGKGTITADHYGVKGTATVISPECANTYTCSRKARAAMSCTGTTQATCAATCPAGYTVTMGSCYWRSSNPFGRILGNLWGGGTCTALSGFAGPGYCEKTETYTTDAGCAAGETQLGTVSQGCEAKCDGLTYKAAGTCGSNGLCQYQTVKDCALPGQIPPQTTVPVPTPPPTPAPQAAQDGGIWSGYSYANSGQPSFQGTKITAGTADPVSSCPPGYKRIFWYSVVSGADAVADAVFACVKETAAPLAIMPKGSWCGYTPVNNGNGNTFFGVHVPCQGKDPKAGCPSGYTWAAFNFVSWNQDSSSDSMYTCIQQQDAPATETPQGTFCGFAFKNAGTYPSVMGTTGSPAQFAVSCQGKDPSQGCPAGYSQAYWTTFAWYSADSIADTVWTCVKRTQPAPAPTASPSASPSATPSPTATPQPGQYCDGDNLMVDTTATVGTCSIPAGCGTKTDMLKTITATCPNGCNPATLACYPECRPAATKECTQDRFAGMQTCTPEGIWGACNLDLSALCRTPPKMTRFDGSTTNLNPILADPFAELKTVQGFVLDAPSSFKLSYRTPVDVCNVDFDGAIADGQGFIAIDSTKLPDSLTRPAQPVTVIMRNLPALATPAIYVADGFVPNRAQIISKGAVCPPSKCGSVTFAGNQAVFEAASFSSFAAGELPADSATPTPAAAGIQTAIKLRCPNTLVIEEIANVSAFYYQDGQPKCVNPALTLIVIGNNSPQDSKFIKCDPATGQHSYSVNTTEGGAYAITAKFQAVASECSFRVIGRAPTPTPELPAIAALAAALAAGLYAFRKTKARKPR